MTDLEMMELCAEAMGFRTHSVSSKLFYCPDEHDSIPKAIWNPLKDDFQALSMVKKCGLSISGPTAKDKDREFYVWCAYESRTDGFLGQSTDLNRAIVECVAKRRQEDRRES